MTGDSKGVAIVRGRDRIEGRKTTQVLADYSSTLYICPRKHSVAPSCLPDYELGVFHILKIRLGRVDTILPGALV